MNNEAKQILMAVYPNSRVIYSDTNYNGFVRVMKALEPSIDGRITLKKKLKENGGIAYYTGRLGAPFTVYCYDNPNYKVRKRKKKK